MYCCRKRQVNILLNNNGKTLPLSTLWFQFQESPNFFGSCISYGVKKKTNITANKDYWHSRKCLPLFICWLFSVT